MNAPSCCANRGLLNIMPTQPEASLQLRDASNWHVVENAHALTALLASFDVGS